MSKARKTFDQARRAVRDFTGEVSVGEFRRMFDQDAVEAYEVLSREHRASEPEDGFERSWHRVRAFFVGLSSKLSPARRLLFILGVALLLWGLVDLFAESSGENGPDVALLLSALIFFYLFTMEIVDRVRVRDELEVAKELQRGLLPVRGPELDDYRFAHSYRTANEVGGDYYDFLPLSGERLALVVGDASGHGMAAGLLMAIANATLKTALDVDPEPLRALGILNRTLCRTGDRRAFMSLFYGMLDPEKGRLDYVCAGHPYPLLRRADGEILELGRGSLPLGIKSDLELSRDTTRLDPGDLLVLYSDGLVEAIREDGEAFGYERLRELIETSASPQAVHDRVLEAFDRFVGDKPLRDDLTLVVISRESYVASLPGRSELGEEE